MEHAGLNASFLTLDMDKYSLCLLDPDQNPENWKAQYWQVYLGLGVGYLVVQPVRLGAPERGLEGTTLTGVLQLHPGMGYLVIQEDGLGAPERGLEGTALASVVRSRGGLPCCLASRSWCLWCP